MNSTIGIFNYESSNHVSLISALDVLPQKYLVSEDLSELSKLEKIIIPGVGNIEYFKNSHSIEDTSRKLKDYLRQGGLLYGICLGMHLLFDFSEEANSKALGIMPGRIVSVKEEFGINLNVGFYKLCWGSEDFDDSTINKLFKDINKDARFYFLHKYFCSLDNKNYKIINSKIENKFLPSLFANDNIVGTQFHPELSKRDGLRFLKNFCDL